MRTKLLKWTSFSPLFNTKGLIFPIYDIFQDLKFRNIHQYLGVHCTCISKETGLSNGPSTMDIGTFVYQT